MLNRKENAVENFRAGRNGMAPRAFRAKTMTAALAAVEKALGNEALIVSVHPSPPNPAWQLWRQEGVEVVAMPSAVASPEAESEMPRPASNLDSDPGMGSRPDSDRPSESFKGRPSESSPRPLPAHEQPAGEQATDIPRALWILRERLRAQGVDEGWLRTMVRSVRERSNPIALSDASLARELVRQELHGNLRSDNGACLLSNRVIGVVGVCGSGKTGACAKIAAYGYKSLGKQVHWVSTDTLRAGAIAKAQAFTAPLGIPLHLAYSPEALASFLHWNSDSDPRGWTGHLQAPLTRPNWVYLRYGSRVRLTRLRRMNYFTARSLGYLSNGQLQGKLLSAYKISQALPGTPPVGAE